MKHLSIALIVILSLIAPRNVAAQSSNCNVVFNATETWNAIGYRTPNAPSGVTNYRITVTAFSGTNVRFQLDEGISPYRSVPSTFVTANGVYDLAAPSATTANNQWSIGVTGTSPSVTINRIEICGPTLPTPTPSITPTPSETLTPTPSETPTETLTPTATETTAILPSETPTETPTASATLVPSETPIPTPTSTPVPTPPPSDKIDDDDTIKQIVVQLIVFWWFASIVHAEWSMIAIIALALLVEPSKYQQYVNYMMLGLLLPAFVVNMWKNAIAPNLPKGKAETFDKEYIK